MPSEALIIKVVERICDRNYQFRARDWHRFHIDCLKAGNSNSASMSQVIGKIGDGHNIVTKLVASFDCKRSIASGCDISHWNITTICDGE